MTAPLAIAGLSALASALSVFLWRHLLRGPVWEDRPRADRHHGSRVSRLGGPAWLAGVLLGLLGGALLSPVSLSIASLALLGSALFLAFLLGWMDDRGRLSPGLKWILQSSLLLGAWAALRWIAPASRGSPDAAGMVDLQTLWTAGVGLAIALLLQTALLIFDNLDGALGSVALMGLLTLALTPGVPLHVALPAWAGAGASAGFLFWNRPPARLFLGNGGSQAVALLCSLLLASAWSDPVMHTPTVWLLILPFLWSLADLLFVSLRRLRAGVPPWTGDRDHTTHRLARRTSDQFAASAIFLAALLGTLLALFLA